MLARYNNLLKLFTYNSLSDVLQNTAYLKIVGSNLQQTE